MPIGPKGFTAIGPGGPILLRNLILTAYYGGRMVALKSALRA